MVFGLIFEVPLAITLMAKLGWVDAPFLKRYRKWALLGSFIFAAILTPTPDPFNQCLMALPMYVFYEVGILSAGFFNKKKPVPRSQVCQPWPPQRQETARRRRWDSRTWERATTSACQQIDGDDENRQIGRNVLQKEDTWLVN